MISRKYEFRALERKPTADFFEPPEILWARTNPKSNYNFFYLGNV